MITLKSTRLSQPQGRAEIALSNPLGLIPDLYLPDIYNTVDGPGIITEIDTVGSVKKFNGVYQQGYIDNPGILAYPYYTAVAVLKVGASTGDMTVATSSNVSYIGNVVQVSHTRMGLGNVASVRAFLNLPYSINDQNFHTLVWVKETQNKAYFFIDGIYVGFNQLNNGNPGQIAALGRLGQSQGWGLVFDGSLAMFASAPNIVTYDAALSLSANPWQIFK